jgi:hypothetical protein
MRPKDGSRAWYNARAARAAVLIRWLVAVMHAALRKSTHSQRSQYAQRLTERKAGFLLVVRLWNRLLGHSFIHSAWHAMRCNATQCNGRYAFVCYADPAVTDHAMNYVNGLQIPDAPLVVRRARVPGQPDAPSLGGGPPGMMMDMNFGAPGGGGGGGGMMSSGILGAPRPPLPGQPPMPGMVHLGGGAAPPPPPPQFANTGDFNAATMLGVGSAPPGMFQQQQQQQHHHHAHHPPQPPMPTGPVPIGGGVSRILVRACVHACSRACVRVRVRACVRLDRGINVHRFAGAHARVVALLRETISIRVFVAEQWSRTIYW